ncbi:helix-turn-helix domain-containing protein [Jiella avicenniae]|uniref:AraC family transcriptional regulator n=1 Tax=Jiella avicenniae TaxID=2907202 RepID=A0A9X1P5I3_9HYPH|nr:AraC family transcriptional regulator [Jiella avicenniae]MCE7029673.1 AraC family transcriptional regulator [Jiella avicenniae]
MTIGSRQVHPGRDLAIGVNSFEPHNHSMMAEGEGGLFLAFYLDPDWIRQRRGIDGDVPLFVDPAIPIDPATHDLMANLVDRLIDGDDPGHLLHYEIVSFVDSLLDAAEAERARQRLPKRAPGARDFRIRKAIALMKANVTARICFDEVAREVGLSRPHFFALFKEQMNVTPNIYWNMLRMEEALRHVQGSDDRLTEIATDLGFTTQGNFSRFFREHVGVPPAVYRSAARSMVA